MVLDTIRVKKDDFQAILTSAVRYALGRRSYIVSWTCNIVKDTIDRLDDNTVDVIILDIDKQLEGYDGMLDNLRYTNWIGLRDYLLEVVKRRKGNG